MAAELCPRCQALRNMRVTVTRRTVVGPDGKTRKLETRTFHCERCGTFVRREEADAAPANR